MDCEGARGDDCGCCCWVGGGCTSIFAAGMLCSAPYGLFAVTVVVVVVMVGALFRVIIMRGALMSLSMGVGATPLGMVDKTDKAPLPLDMVAAWRRASMILSKNVVSMGYTGWSRGVGMRVGCEYYTCVVLNNIYVCNVNESYTYVVKHN